MKTNPYDLAFPNPSLIGNNYGLTKREWFVGCLLGSKNAESPDDMKREAASAVAFADEVIAALNKEPEVESSEITVNYDLRLVREKDGTFKWED